MARPEKPLDPDAGAVARFADALRQLRHTAALSYRDLGRKSGHSLSTLSQAAAGDRLPSLAVTLAYVEACGADRREWEGRWREADRAVRQESAAGRAAEGPSPYRGLARYEADDAALFFGRGRLTDQLTALVARHRLTVVLGPSGSGKSSLLRAGLIPRLQHPGSETALRVAALRILTPGPHPSTHHPTLDPAPGEGDTVVIVDQFEEVFTLCQDPEERAAFLDLILTARHPGSRVRIVLGVRADFYSHCLLHPGLADVLREASLPVGPMTEEELREAITKPAVAHALIVERALTARLVEEVAAEPGGLPLMSHALLETWRHRTGRTLSLDAYRAAGGLNGAVARTAETLYTALSEDQAALTRRILLRLITPGDGTPDTRRPVDRKELDRPDGTDLVLERLASARLVTLDDGQADLAHEALITAWPRLHRWIDDNRDRMRLHRQLTDAAHTWRQLDRDKGELWRGPRLAAADAAFGGSGRDTELTPQEREFLTACLIARDLAQRAAQRARRRTRAMLASLSVLVVLALIAGAAAWQQNRAGDRKSLQGAARTAAATAVGLRTTDPTTALRLSVAAWKLHPSPETKSALFGALGQPERLPIPLPADLGDFRAVSPDGRTMTVSTRGQVVEWDLSRRRITASWQTPRPKKGSSTLSGFSPDGRTLAVPTGRDERLRLWDFRAQRYRGAAFGPSLSNILSVDFTFSADGRVVLFYADGKPEIWDTVRSLRLPTHAFPDYPLDSLDFAQLTLSPDGRLLAHCLRSDTGPELWDIARDRRIPGSWSKEAACPNATVQISPQGHLLAIADTNGIRLWDIPSGRQLPPLVQEGLGDQEYVMLSTSAISNAPLGHEFAEYRFSEDGTFIASLNKREIRVWRLNPPLDIAYPPPTLVFHHPLPDTAPKPPHDLRLDTRTGLLHYISTPQGGQQEMLQTLDVGSALTPRRGDGPTVAVFSADGSTLALTQRQGRTTHSTVLDALSGHERTTVPEQSADNGTRELIALSADGRYFAHVGRPPGGSANATLIEVWDTSRPGHRPRHLATLHSTAPKTSFTGLLISPDGRTVITTDSDAVLTLWDITNGKRLRKLDEPKGPGAPQEGNKLSSISPDGRLLLTNTGSLLRLTDGKTLSTDVGCTGCVSAFSPDSRHIAIGSNWATQGIVRYGKPPADLTPLPARLGDNEKLAALAFSPDGEILAAVGDNGTLRLWDTASHQPLDTALPTVGGVTLALAFSPDGRTLHTASKLVPPQSYDVDFDHAARTICERAGGPLDRTDWAKYLPRIPYRTTC
ncbi:helix-turn-helix domain-containing protein [Streptomyces noboritoensis]|uniref:Helix-turn-helix domain-containing protein n=1 Tax=Streptomyces noboritoensis TaxID=67337 RepID=A0ABV6TDZ2_9ACTN